MTTLEQLGFVENDFSEWSAADCSVYLFSADGDLWGLKIVLPNGNTISLDTREWQP